MAYHLYLLLQSKNETIPGLSVTLWKSMLLQKPGHVTSLLKSTKITEYKELVEGFARLVESVAKKIDDADSG
jgi:hypothetical protein